MIADRPLFGHGSEGFRAKYMLYQARYFESNPESLQAALADNVNHPFNEYLFLIVRYGIVGFLGLALPFSVFIFYLSCDRSRVYRTVLAFFIAIGVLACFSYPFYYPVILILMLLITLLAAVEYCIRCKRPYKLVVVSTLWLAGCLLLLPYVMPDSRLYNVAVDLNREGRYAQSISVLEKYCRVSMDVQGAVLMANNYYYLGNLEKAECWAELAGHMCPNRFIPLYQRFLIYVESGDTAKAKRLGTEIIQKNEKIPSYVIKQIKGNVEHKLKSL